MNRGRGRRAVGVLGSAWALAGLAGTAWAEDDAVTFKGALTWQTSAVATKRADFAANPRNEAYGIPDWAAVTELKPNLSLRTKDFQLIGRPRLRYQYAGGERGGRKTTPRATHESYWNEAFLQWTVSDAVTLAWGRQNYQWGGAEVASPSNRIFRDVVTGRTVLTEPEGLNLVRVNISAGRAFSVVAMAEYEDNPDRAKQREGDVFQAKGLVKPEVNWNGGSDYMGLVIGGREHGQGWLGEYGSVAVPGIDGLSVYFDASHQRASEAWYPVEESVATPLGPARRVVYEQAKAKDTKAYTFAVGGVRYDFTNGATLRFEGVWNQAGYGKDEWRREARAFAPDASPLQRQALVDATARSAYSGLDLPGQRYGFASLYYPDLAVKDLTASVRTLVSATDGSSANYVALDYALAGGGGSVYTAHVAQGGAANSELVRVVRSQHIVGYRHAW